MRTRLIFVLSLLISVLSAVAVPAYRKPFVVKQSDGSELTVVLTGDEALHYYVTLDGKPLVKESNGDYSYATFGNAGVFLSTKQLAHNAGFRSAVEESLLLGIDNDAMISKISKATASRSAKYKSAAKKAGSQIKPEGEINVAVVLVEFPDKKFTYTKEDIHNILNTENFVYENVIANSIGSARDYFIAQSDGKFKPNFLVTDIVTLDNKMSYYGGNDSKGDDLRPTYMIRDGIKKADANFDFSKCDNNGDGEVEFVYCIYAGYSESYQADANTVWPHQWELSAQCGSITVDSVKCDAYACSSELILNESYEEGVGKMLNGIGTMCHEFSHCLGLHDIYDVTYKSGNFGMDFWDLMDQGNYVGEGYLPVGYSAYQRDFCGWRDLVVLEESGEYSMKALTQGGIGYKVINEANPDEYYILENRKQEGWDTGIFNSGMLVVHVDYLKSAWDSNNINTVAGHPRYTIIPADNDLAIYGTVSNAQFRESMAGDVWPGTKGNTALTNVSIPAAEVYTGGYMNKPITDIKYENNIISFVFSVGVSTPMVKPATDVTETSFVANWTGVKGVQYVVELYKGIDVAEGAGDEEELLYEDFLKCSQSNFELTNENVDDYMFSTGWTCENVYSENGVLRIGSTGKAGYINTPLFNTEGNVKTTLRASLCEGEENAAFTIEYCDKANNAFFSKKIEFSRSTVDIELSADVDGEFSIYIATDDSTGACVNIDDLLITLCTSVKKELVQTVTTTDTSYKFENLYYSKKFLYRVQTFAGNEVSAFSEFEEVVLLSEENSINDVIAETDFVEIYSITGTKVYSGTLMDVQKLNRGVYIVKGTSLTKKLFVY